MRTGKIGLNRYLHKIGKADSARCGCNNSWQTVRHIIEDCFQFRELRKKFLDTRVFPDYRLALTDLKTAINTAKFIIATSLLDQFRYFIDK
jgi:hypothetical protein